MKKMMSLILSLTLVASTLAACSGLGGAEKKAFDILVYSGSYIAKDRAPVVGYMGTSEVRLSVDPATIRIESGTLCNQVRPAEGGLYYEPSSSGDHLLCVVTFELADGIRSEGIPLVLFFKGDAGFLIGEDRPEHLELAQAQNLDCEAINKALEDHYKKK